MSIESDLLRLSVDGGGGADWALHAAARSAAAELSHLRERLAKMEGREKLFLIAIRWMAANGIYFDDDMESWRDRIDYRISIPDHLAPLIAEATKQQEQSND